jgi:hypothetical protein
VPGLCSLRGGPSGFLASDEMWKRLLYLVGLTVDEKEREKIWPETLRIDAAELPGRVTTVQYSS